ncbi:tight adherence pilus pseudopilin TadF [Veronia pacifica]
MMKKQRGVFAIEMAFVLSFLIVLLLFLTDLSRQVLLRGELDQLSYNLVTIVKERSRLQVSQKHVSQQELKRLLKVTDKLRQTDEMTRAYSLRMTSLVEGRVADFTFKATGSPRAPTFDKASFTRLVAKPKEGKALPLYRVAVSETISSPFSMFLGGKNGQVTIESASVMVGR